MKPLIIAVSLLANAALLATFAFRPALAPPAVRDFFARHFSSADATTGSAPPHMSASAPRTAAPHPLWSEVRSDELATLIARLRAAGFPPSVVREIVRNQVNARYSARIRALTEPDLNTPYWKLPAYSYGADSKNLVELNQLEHERSNLLRTLLKDDPADSGDTSAAQRRQFGDLSRGKIDAIQRIEDDYSEMGTAITAAMKGVTLPEDRDKLALLAREKNADLAAILTPDELVNYTMRSSPITSMLRSQLGTFDPSLEEFRAIFQMQQALNEKFPVSMSGGMVSTGDYNQRQTVQQQLDEQLKAALGDARYTDYTRSTNRDFIQLNRLVQNDNLPPATAVQAFNLRDAVAQQSNQILDDSSLGYDDKKVALQTLAQNTRAQLLATLGPASGPAYVKIADGWLTNVERGAAVTFTNSSSSTSISSNNGVTAMVTMNSSYPNYRRLPNPAPQPNP
jgi:hypothetical protein